MRDLKLQGVETLDRFTGGREGTLWYYAEVADALSEGWSHQVLSDLVSTVAQMHELVGVEVGRAKPPP